MVIISTTILMDIPITGVWRPDQNSLRLPRPRGARVFIFVRARERRGRWRV